VNQNDDSRDSRCPPLGTNCVGAIRRSFVRSSRSLSQRNSNARASRGPGDGCSKTAWLRGLRSSAGATPGFAVAVTVPKSTMDLSQTNLPSLDFWFSFQSSSCVVVTVPCASLKQSASVKRLRASFCAIVNSYAPLCFIIWSVRRNLARSWRPEERRRGDNPVDELNKMKEGETDAGLKTAALAVPPCDRGCDLSLPHGNGACADYAGVLVAGAGEASYDFAFCFFPGLPLFPAKRCVALFLLSSCRRLLVSLAPRCSCIGGTDPSGWDRPQILARGIWVKSC
jgi:hypothetical protein